MIALEQHATSPRILWLVVRIFWASAANVIWRVLITLRDVPATASDWFPSLGVFARAAVLLSPAIFVIVGTILGIS